jgi:twitching motility protein PilT
MSQKKPAALIGRLAVQLKMVTMDQLVAATREQGEKSESQRLGEILVELGFITAAQLQKLQEVQRQVLAKHRAKNAAMARSVDPQPVPDTRARSKSASPDTPPPEPASDAPTAVGAPPVSPPQPDSQPVPPAQPEVPPSRAEKLPPRTLGDADSDADGEGDSLALVIPGASEADRTRLEEVLRGAVEAGASDIHVHSGAPLRIRVNGEFMEAGSAAISRDDAERLVSAALSDSQAAELARCGELDLCLDLPGIGRFRCSAYRQQRGLDIVLRSIPPEPPTLEQLNLPSELAKFTNYHQGMVLITGPAGCGKSATMAALVNLINEERQEHILTVEDPIEVIHTSKRCLVNQRHAGRHTASFARALRGALREDPDVIVIGELRDLETISLAMTAAETGHFVLATLHTNNAVRTINRMIGAFPSNQQSQIRTMLSESLRAVISQRLVPAADDSGRIPALEILVITKAIGNLVREEKTIQIRSAIQTGKNLGMCLLEQSLNELVGQKKISKEMALSLAEDKKLITAG